MKQTLLEKNLIICDYREREITKLLKQLNAKVSVTALPYGDFLVGNIAIERKSHSDFISSIIDGRIFSQIKNLKENFEKVILIVEGFSERKINENALKGAIATLLIDEGVSVVNTLNARDTAKTILWIARKIWKRGKYNSIKILKKGKNIREMQERIVANLPGIGIKIARRLLKHFKNVKNVFNASEDELQKVRGIGKEVAKRIKEVIESNYG